MKQPVVLRIYRSEKLEAVRQFDQSQIIIGRNSDAHLDLQDDGIALLHAMIEDRGDDYYVSDLGSKTGTFKNGSRVLEDKLISGDEFNIGPFRIQFFLGVPKPALTRTNLAMSTPSAPETPSIEINSLHFSQSLTETPPPLGGRSLSINEVKVPPSQSGSANPIKTDDKPAHPSPNDETLPAAAPPPKVPPPKPMGRPGFGAQKSPQDAAKPASSENVAIKPWTPTKPESSEKSDLTAKPRAPVKPQVQSQSPIPPPTPTPTQTRASSSVIEPSSAPVPTPMVAPLLVKPLISHKAVPALPPMRTLGSGSHDLKDIIKPGKGSLVEVIVAWHDRVLSTYHFSEKGSVFISSNEDADVVVPIISSSSRYELLKIGAQVTVCLTPEMTGEVIRDGEVLAFSELSRQNKLRNVGTHFELDLRQGEMIRCGLQEGLISIYVRYVAETPKPLIAPLLDMTSSEVTGIILALAISAIMALYMSIYTPTPLQDDEAKLEEPIRMAIVRFDPPKPKAPEEPPKETPQKKVVVIKEQKAKTALQHAVEKSADTGRPGEVAPNQNKNKTKKITSNHQGGAIKTSPKEGASAKSERPDPTKSGLLAAFGSHGTQKNLDKAFSGSGELVGMADAATGHAGNAENREGDNLGTKLKDIGAGGKGSQTIGIAGLGTKGRGTGDTGYGAGGLGKKGSVQINVSGQEGEFSGSMDKEAIRRVIREHLREIRTCYERELQRSPDLYGKLVLEWDIEEGGRVSRCVVKSNALGNDQVADCISSHLKTWRFPNPPANMVGRVSYPFVFSSN